MRINVFEGARRIALLCAAIWALGSGYFAFFDASPSVNLVYTISWPDEPAVRINQDSCPGETSAEWRDASTTKGTKIELMFCFQEQKGGNGEMLIPYKVDRAAKRWFGSESYTTEISDYKRGFSRNFVVPKADEEWADKQTWRVIWKRVVNFAQWLLGGLIGIWLFTAVVGWIVRGFAGIPSGSDKRPEA